jgi:hypothetical protein
VFDAGLRVYPMALTWKNMSTSLSSLVSLLPAASVIITGVVMGIMLGRHDNRAEERFDP